MNAKPSHDTDDERYATNRSEIALMWDARDCNPNGNPLSGADRPRMDPRTDQAIVTDVRLKRYLRDQLSDDGHTVYLDNVEQEDGSSPTREYLIRNALDVDDAEDLPDDIYAEFLDRAVDARMFGATFSLSSDSGAVMDEINKSLPQSLTGPIQFSPGKSIHPVTTNENYENLTSIVATKEEKEGGGYGLNDHRLQYAMIRFHGVVDGNRGAQTHLTETDVERLDTLCWRALKNQTLTRSKVGQQPQLYVRAEYVDGATHLGNLGAKIAIDGDHVSDPSLMRTTADAYVDVTEFVERLGGAADRIETVHTVAGDLLNITHEGIVGDADYFYTVLGEALGEDRLHVIDVHEESRATMPEEPEDGG